MGKHSSLKFNYSSNLKIGLKTDILLPYGDTLLSTSSSCCT
jgi:hypothetical protein